MDGLVRPEVFVVVEHDETDETILDAAERIFAEHGFHETVVADVADEAGVGKGTVYRRFGNKTDLFSELVCVGSRELIEELRESVSPDDAFEERLRTIVEVHFDFFEGSGEIFRIIVQEGLSNFGEWQGDIVGTWEDYRGFVRTFFEDEVASDVLRSDLDPEKCARILGNLIMGTLRSAVIFDEESPRDRYQSHLSEIFLDGVTERET